MQSQASFNMQVIVLVTVCLLIKPNKQKYFSLKRPGYIAMHQFFFLNMLYGYLPRVVCQCCSSAGT